MSKPPPMPIIAGANAGVKVRVSNPAFAAIFNNLETLARQGNYHAVVAVNHIHSLSSGNMKPNVYIHDSLRDDKNWVFTMILPGCRMDVEKRPNGEFLVYGLVADENYLEMQAAGKQPGLYHLRKESNSDQWKADFASNGKIVPQPLRTVIVADRAGTLDEAIEASLGHVGNAPVGGNQDHIEHYGFDLHFTPGEDRIGGLKNIQQAMGAKSDSSLHETAVLLAETMTQASDVPKVAWVSEKGGCGVVTQALQILKNRGVKFSEGSAHHIYYRNPTTHIVAAETLAREVGLRFKRETHNINPLNLNELIGGHMIFGGHMAAIRRRRQSPGEYTRLQLASDLVSHTTGLTGTAKTVGLSISAGTMAAIGTAALGGSFPAVAAFATAVTSAFGVGAAVVNAYFPRFYGKIKGKF